MRAALALALAVSACSDPPPPPAPPAAPSAPPVKDAIAAIYTAYAASPSTYERGPVLSAFYKEDNARIDAACQAGEDHPRCRGDRFACLTRLPLPTSGVLKDAVVNGEQPGVSASVKVTIAYGTDVVTADVDAVFEGGAWKVDQVRCAAP